MMKSMTMSYLNFSEWLEFILAQLCRGYLWSREVHDFEQLWDVFIGEKMRLEDVSTTEKDKDDKSNLALTDTVRRGR